MNKTEIPKFYWLLRTPDNRLAVRERFSSEKAYVIPDEKLSRLPDEFGKEIGWSFRSPLMGIFLVILYWAIGIAPFIYLVILALLPFIMKALLPLYIRLNTRGYDVVESQDCIALSPQEISEVEKRRHWLSRWFSAGLILVVVFGFWVFWRYLKSLPQGDHYFGTGFAIVFFTGVIIFLLYAVYLVGRAVSELPGDLLIKLSKIRSIDQQIATRVTGSKLGITFVAVSDERIDKEE